ncbi:hypothetical protein COBT_000682 [Conglomerata obtusa]
MLHKRLANKKTVAIAIFYLLILKSASIKKATVDSNQKTDCNSNKFFLSKSKCSLSAEFSALHLSITHKFQENQLAISQLYNNIYVAFLIDKSVLKTDLFIKRTVLNYLDILESNASYNIIEYDDKNNSNLDFDYIFRQYFLYRKKKSFTLFVKNNMKFILSNAKNKEESKEFISRHINFIETKCTIIDNTCLQAVDYDLLQSIYREFYKYFNGQNIILISSKIINTKIYSRAIYSQSLCNIIYASSFFSKLFAIYSEHENHSTYFKAEGYTIADNLVVSTGNINCLRVGLSKEPIIDQDLIKNEIKELFISNVHYFGFNGSFKMTRKRTYKEKFIIKFMEDQNFDCMLNNDYIQINFLNKISMVFRIYQQDYETFDQNQKTRTFFFVHVSNESDQNGNLLFWYRYQLSEKNTRIYTDETNLYLLSNFFHNLRDLLLTNFLSKSKLCEDIMLNFPRNICLFNTVDLNVTKNLIKCNKNVFIHGNIPKFTEIFPNYTIEYLDYEIENYKIFTCNNNISFDNALKSFKNANWTNNDIEFFPTIHFLLRSVLILQLSQNENYKTNKYYVTISGHHFIHNKMNLCKSFIDTLKQLEYFAKDDTGINLVPISILLNKKLIQYLKLQKNNFMLVLLHYPDFGQKFIATICKSLLIFHLEAKYITFNHDEYEEEEKDIVIRSYKAALYKETMACVDNLCIKQLNLLEQIKLDNSKINHSITRTLTNYICQVYTILSNYKSLYANILNKFEVIHLDVCVLQSHTHPMNDEVVKIMSAMATGLEK